jgi:hypothetical protein
MDPSDLDGGNLATILDAGRGEDGGFYTDSGSAPMDSGSAPMDSGSAPMDSGSAPIDSGTSPMDSGTLPMDSGTLPMDSGTSTMDSGTSTMDSGTSTMDSGTSTMDSGTSTMDSGTSTDSGSLHTSCPLLCAANEFCEYPEGTCGLGANPELVTCTEKPDLCFEIYDPVCGCDGMTYGNDCVRASAGVSLDYIGECESET